MTVSEDINPDTHWMQKPDGAVFIEQTVVTSFPQLWDETGRQGRLAREIWMSLIEKVLNGQKNGIRAAQLDADDLLAEIAKACLRFRPSFRLMGREYTYPDVFASEIAFVVRFMSRPVSSRFRLQPLMCGAVPPGDEPLQTVQKRARAFGQGFLSVHQARDRVSHYGGRHPE